MNVKPFQAIVATDLDGTLLCSQGKCSPRNLELLKRLNSIPVLRVVATGRSLFAAQKALPQDFPLDLLVFSSGAGIWDWKSRTVLHQTLISRAEALQTAAVLQQNGLSFFAHAPIPDNHRFWYYKSVVSPPDFARRCEMHGDLAQSWEGDFPQAGITQFIVMTDTVTAGESLIELRRLLPELSIVRATSPWNPAVTWLEVFTRGISKGYALKWVQGHLALHAAPTFALGNDYNDIELLDWATHSSVVGNAPADLLKKYPAVADNESDGFFHAVTAWLASNSSKLSAERDWDLV